MRGIIWYQDPERGLRMFKDVVSSYKSWDIKPSSPTSVRFSSIGCLARFENGDSWELVRASDNARGRTCNIAYIDKEVSEDMLERVVYPCLRQGCDAPWTAYKYY